MALSENYKNRLKFLQSATTDLELALAEDLTQFTDRQQDILRNGQVQKFEFCIELLWKVLKVYLYEREGVDEGTPKSVIKAYYRTGKIASSDFEELIQMIEDRNILSHLYSQIEFLEIHLRLFRHIRTIRSVVNLLIHNDRV